MEFKEVVGKRQTIRDFETKAIPASVVEYAIQNAFKAPTHNHLREWDFIIVSSLEAKLKLIQSEHLEKSIDINELEKLFRDEETIMKEMYLDAIPKQKKMILDAPQVMLVVYKPKTSVEKAQRIYDLNCLASVWTCIENFLLSLAEHEVFGVTFIPQNTGLLKEKFGIPLQLEVAAVIPIGYRAEDAKTLKQKAINIVDRIHRENW
jgi:nitroreductase